MSNDRYAAGALIQRLHGLMSCARPEQRFNFLFNFCVCVWLQEGTGLAWRGWGVGVCGFLQRQVALACPKAPRLGGLCLPRSCPAAPSPPRS